MTFLLAVCMAVSLLAVPAGAANTAAVTFSDLGDKSTAVAVESLRPHPGAVLQDGGLRHERQQ